MVKYFVEVAKQHNNKNELLFLLACAYGAVTRYNKLYICLHCTKTT